MQNLALVVFDYHIMSHLGLADMVAIQYSCKHGHHLVLSTREKFMRYLHIEMKSKLEVWSGWKNMCAALQFENEQRRDSEYGFFCGVSNVEIGKSRVLATA